MAPYTINTCENPSAEVHIGGYGTNTGIPLEQDFSISWIGSASVKTTNPGVSDLGMSTPIFETESISTETWTGSLYIRALTAGFVNVTLYTGGGFSTQPVFLTAEWQRVTFAGISCPPGANQVFLYVSTPDAMSFWVDGVQYEQNSGATEYCDGDQYGCTWLGVPHSSASQREVEFAAQLDGSENSDGYVLMISEGEIFPDSALGEDTTDIDESFVAISIGDPEGVFDDFVMYPTALVDPALSYVRVNNAGEVSGEFGRSWMRNFGLFVPPIDYPTSDGYAWKRAAYAAVGFRYANFTGSNWQYLDAVQLEKHHINTVSTSYLSGHRYDPGDTVSQSGHYYVNLVTSMGTAPPATATSNATWRYTGEIWGPSEYTTPRQLHTVVKPTVMNFVQNPSFEVSTNYWHQQDTTISRVNTVTPPFGTWALRVRSAATIPSQQAFVDVEQLIVGRTYTFSAYIKVDVSIYDVTLTMGSGSASVQGFGIPYGGLFPDYLYGGGPYGGILPPGPDSGLDVNKWYRIYGTFTADSYTERLSLIPSFTSDAAYPSDFWVDAVMVEEGAIVHDYVDGSLGADYLWEESGIAGEARSYYYEGRRVKQYTIEDTIQESVPIGITAQAPVYAQPYSQ